MDSLHIREADPGERRTLGRLLAGAGLPTDTIEAGPTVFYVALQDGKVVAGAGFEHYGADVFLRSVVVDPAHRDRGLGRVLIAWMIDTAGRLGRRRMALLTNTAEGFFRKMGFRTVRRTEVGNEAMLRSSEFVETCDETAACMLLDLPASMDSLSSEEEGHATGKK